MNANEQQRVLQAIMQASSQLAAAAQAFAGGNGGTPTVPSLYLDFLPPAMRDRARDFFVYSVDFANIATTSTSTGTFTVQNDSDFLVVAINGEEVDPANESTAITTSPLLITVTDGGSGRNWFNRAQAYANIVGTGQLPAFLPYPKFVDRSSDVSVTITNNAAAQAARIRLSFVGFKIFDIMRGA
jgi:hypothetical protein